MRVSLDQPCHMQHFVLFKSNYILKKIIDVNEIVVKGEWILVADSTECG